MALYSCETYDAADPDFSNTYPAYVEIANTAALTVPEGGNISVTLSSRSVIYESYTVSYEITGDYNASGTVDVPKGVNSQVISLPVAAGIVTSDALSATVTLTAVSGDVALGRNGDNLSVDVTITKFVPFVQADYATTFLCDEPGYAVYQAELVAAAEPNVLTNTNFWDAGLSVDYTFSADFEQTVVINPQVVDYGGTPLTVSGSGTYNGVTKTMVVDYTVVDADGGVWDDNTHTFELP
ncbi:hypothetical protein KAJ27_11050 [bacterium]|nr:hypothetical protein [bacterium]